VEGVELQNLARHDSEGWALVGQIPLDRADRGFLLLLLLLLLLMIVCYALLLPAATGRCEVGGHDGEQCGNRRRHHEYLVLRELHYCF